MELLNSDHLIILINAFSVILVAIGVVLSLIQWRKSNSIKRADYINELNNRIRSDDDIKNMIYMIEYDVSWYNEAFHKNGDKELERKIDVTLAYFSYVCYLRKKRIITNSEFRCFEYAIHKVLRNNQIQDYIYNIYHFSRPEEIERIPGSIECLFLYGKEKKLFDDDFEDSTAWEKSDKYHHYWSTDISNFKF